MGTHAPFHHQFNSKDIDREDVMDLVEMALSKEKLTDSDVASLSAKLYSFPEIKKVNLNF